MKYNLHFKLFCGGIIAEIGPLKRMPLSCSSRWNIIKALESRRSCILIKPSQGGAGGSFAAISHVGIIALFIQAISGKWYKPDYAEIITLSCRDESFPLEEDN